MSDAQHKVAVVTGGAGAIGGAIVARLAALGIQVVVIDRAGGDIVCDLGDERQVREAASRVLRDHGRCDILVHAAAEYTRDELADVDISRWRRVQAVNVEAALLLSQTLAPGMAAHGFGRIVFVVSDSVWAPPVPDLVDYIASKGALVALTRTLAHALGGAGISVTAVAPGITPTPSAIAGTPQALFDDQVSKQALPRLLTPEDVAAAVEFLVSDGAAAVTGQTICIDGGMVMR